MHIGDLLLLNHLATVQELSSFLIFCAQESRAKELVGQRRRSRLMDFNVGLEPLHTTVLFAGDDLSLIQLFESKSRSAKSYMETCSSY
jgi:hypothetical protein